MIRYDPKKLLKQIAPKAKLEKLLRPNSVTVKKAALSFVDDIPYLSKGALLDVALKTVKTYQDRIKALDEAGQQGQADQILDDPRLLIQRMENAVLYQVGQGIRENYKGEQYEWLPSDAEEADPEHQLLYGKVFNVGEGDSEGNMPGERYGCRCGMNILVKQTQLKLG